MVMMMVVMVVVVKMTDPYHLLSLECHEHSCLYHHLMQDEMPSRGVAQVGEFG